MPITQKSNRVEYTNDRGILHRDDGPAVVREDGYEAYYLNGYLKRVRLPDGRMEFYKGARIERIEHPDGSVEHFANGKRVPAPETP